MQTTYKLYCLVIAGWLKKFAYSHKDYYYATVDTDPFDYSYKPGVRVKDSLRRKLAIREAMQNIERVPPFVLNKAAGDRRLLAK
jgi:hypothetical protein